MSTYLPYRAQTFCSLGHLISGRFADTYLQQAGLIFCRGEVELAGLYRPDVGTVVEFAYSRGDGNASRLPRKLRVLSSFADPFTRKTTVQLGCKLSLLQENREPPEPDEVEVDPARRSSIKPADTDPTYDTAFKGVVAGNVSAKGAAEIILTRLGITAAATLPLTHRYLTDEFSLQDGFVEVLGKLLESECYVGYLDEQEQLVVRSLLDSGSTTGPVFTADNTFTLSPIGVGNQPGETVYVSYTDLDLNPNTVGTSTTLAIAGRWGREITVGFPVSYSISYTSGGGPAVFTSSYRPVVETTTRFDGAGRPVYTKSYTSKPYAAAAGGYGSQALSNGLSITTSHVGSYTETSNTYDRQGRVSRTVTSEVYSLIEFTGSIDLNFVFSPSDYLIVPAEGTVVKERTVTEYIYNRGATRRSVTRYQNWALTQNGQQATAAGKASFTTSSQVETFYNSLLDGLTAMGTEVSITLSAAETQPQQLPGDADLTVQTYGKDQARGQQTVKLDYQFGASEAERIVNFSLPYSPDSYYTFSGATATPVSAVSKAKTSAMNYGRIQNRLRLGNRQGLSLQVPVELMPTKPFDPLYLQAEGLTGQYRANGMSWTFDQNGIVGQVDALFWLAIGGT